MRTDFLKAAELRHPTIQRFSPSPDLWVTEAGVRSNRRLPQFPVPTGVLQTVYVRRASARRMSCRDPCGTGLDYNQLLMAAKQPYPIERTHEITPN